MPLHDGQDPQEARGALADCINETDRLLHVIDTLLDISAAEGGALRLARSSFDLRSLAERAADLYSEVAEEKGIELKLDLPVAIDVEADAVRLGQVVNNLLDNALKYTPAGGHVTTATSAEGAWATLSVTDDGPWEGSCGRAPRGHFPQALPRRRQQVAEGPGTRAEPGAGRGRVPRGNGHGRRRPGRRRPFHRGAPGSGPCAARRGELGGRLVLAAVLMQGHS